MTKVENDFIDGTRARGARRNSWMDAVEADSAASSSSGRGELDSGPALRRESQWRLFRPSFAVL